MISLSRFHDRQLPRCVLPTTATHYLTNCTRARGFPGSLRKNLSIFSEPERSMRFTTPSIASAGESVFAFEKCSFPKPDVPTPLLFSSPASAPRFHFFEWLSKLLGFYPERLTHPPLSKQDVQLREGSRLFCSSSREGDANAAIRNQVPEIRGSSFRANFKSSVLPPITRKNVCHFTRRSFEAPSFEDLKPISCEIGP